MVFFRYFLRRYFIYFFTVTLLLTFLFNFIEFFEKLVRTSQTRVFDIFYFVFLNSIPAFFDLIPLGVWLATCLLLKEFQQHGEWESLFLLNISNKKMARYFAFAGLFVMVPTIFLHESFGISIANKMQQFKMTAFKQRASTKIFRKWYQLDTKIFCYFDMLDCEKKEGKNLLLFYLNDDFTIKKVVNSANFSIIPEKSKVQIFQADVLEPQSESGKSLRKDFSVYVPNFFLHLKLGNHIPKLLPLFSKLIHSTGLFSFEIGREIARIIFDRLFFYLQIFLYPLMTFLFFVSLNRDKYYKWIVIFVPYVLITFFTSLSSFLFQKGLPILLLLVPYFFIFAILFFLFIRLQEI